MIIMRLLIIIQLLVFITNMACGQLIAKPSLNNDTSIECNTEADDEYWEYMESTRELRESIDLNNMRQTYTIYIAAHIIVDDETNPTNEFGVEEVDESIESLNQWFNPVGFSFERCLDVNFISELEYPQPEYDDIYPNFPYGSQTMADVIANEGAVGHLNVYFVDTRETSDGSLVTSGGNASLPDGSLDNDGNLDIDFVLLYTNQGVSQYTIAHEVGHHFNLLHTYSGNNDILKRENVARTGSKSNCGLSGIGDELCDTPADPTFMTVYTYILDGEELEYKYKTPRCSTSENESPPCKLHEESELISIPKCNMRDQYEDLYLPPTKNFMGAGYRKCINEFTFGQITRMRTSLLVDRPHLLSNNCNECETFKDFPATHLHNENTFEIHSVSEDIISEAIVKGQNLSPDAVPAHTIYNAGESVCLYPSFEAEYGSTFLAYIEGCEPITNLKTGDQVSLNTIINGLNVQPNPFSDNTNIEFDLAQDSRLTVGLFDLLGNRVQVLTNSKSYESGKHLIPINGTNLPAGIYYCTIQAGNHIETQKMVLTK